MPSTNKFSVKPKKPKAPWTRIKSPGFLSQQKQLRPEETPARAGNTRRSGAEELRMSIYRPIADLFKHQNPWCAACPKITNCDPNDSKLTQDVHHKRGRNGLLLFDLRYFLPVCRTCHIWIGENPQKARELGLDESHQIC